MGHPVYLIYVIMYYSRHKKYKQIRSQVDKKATVNNLVGESLGQYCTFIISLTMAIINNNYFEQS